MSQQHYFNQHPDRTYLDVEYEEKDVVKALGAWWDADCPRGPYAMGKWYIPPALDGNVEAFAKWLPSNHPKSANYVPPPAQTRALDKRKRALERREAQVKAVEQRLAKQKAELRKREAEIAQERVHFEAERQAQIAAHAAERQEMRELMQAQLAAFAAHAPGGSAGALRGHAQDIKPEIKQEHVKEEYELEAALPAERGAVAGGDAAGGAGPSTTRGIKRERSIDEAGSLSMIERLQRRVRS